LDFPREELLPPTPPNHSWIENEDNIEDAFFIAKCGKSYIGYSHLCKTNPVTDRLIQGNTAVLNEYRGKGVATTLKIKGIDFAKNNGYNRIYTSFRNTNGPMKRVNEKLGWNPYSSEVRLQKIFS
jgi:mycothiol synthase